MRLVGAVRRYRGDGPFRVYTLVIARRAVAGVLQGERRRRVLAAAQRASTAETSEDSSGLLALRELVTALPAGLRQAFVLTLLTGLTYDQAAEEEHRDARR